MQQDRWATNWLQSSFAEKFLGVPSDNCNMSQQSILKVSHILSCTSKSVASRLREVILAFCLVLVRLCLEDCVLFWILLYEMDFDILE